MNNTERTFAKHSRKLQARFKAFAFEQHKK